MKDFYAIFKEHDGLVSQRWTHYPFVYDKIFERFCNKDTSLTLLEIGVQNGGGLEIWKKYLPSNSIIHGIDINPKCECLQFSENIYFHLGNATDSAFINSAFKDDTKFDVILDDGSHNSKDVITAFESLFWRLKDGGIYIIEDLEHSYWKNSGGGFRKKKASIEYFKRLVDALNLQHIKGHRKQRMLLEKFNSRISSIYFYSGICVIETS
ncbi:MAG: class I SAM-dependent methyltransferase [Spirochaetaceae bacterium]|nr:class I SAM-dependent methyltransferase [Spirochaetaceae bacterium]